MANFSYPASSIIGGVSNLEYAIRTDSQATNQENCLLSPKYGLCKRPNTEYITKIKSHTSTAAGTVVSTSNVSSEAPFLHTLAYGADERLLVGARSQGDDVSGLFSDSQYEHWILLVPDTGAKNVICHFPSSKDEGAAAIHKYEDQAATVYTDPAKISFATVGDNTFINYPQVGVGMKDDTWEGYTEHYDGTGSDTDKGRTILNDEVFAIWVKAHQVGEQKYNVALNFNGAATTATEAIELTTKNVDSGAVGGYYREDDIKNDTKTIAGILAFQISQADITISEMVPAVDASHPAGTTIKPFEATNLSDNDYLAASGTFGDKAAGGNNATNVITGRIFDSIATNDNLNEFVFPNELRSVSAECGRGHANISVCHKTVTGTSKLPPRSWKDHTVTVDDPSNDGGDPFYMRFVSDEGSEADFEYGAGSNAFEPYTNFPDSTAGYDVNTKTTKLPRQGHWEEYVKTGIKTTIDSATMPHILTRRVDGSFVMMEGRGAFQINSNGIASFDISDNECIVTVSAGFSEDGNSGTVDGDPLWGDIIDTGNEISALIPGDTIVFDTGATLPPELEVGKTYYIKTVSKTSVRIYTLTFSETDGGATIVLSGSDITNQAAKIKLTSYEHLGWATREAGDDSSNPIPDFIGRGINQVFTYQNRLGFVSDKEVWFSGTGDPLNVFRLTVRDLIESDPFGVTPSDSRGDLIRSVSPYGQNLVVITNEAQHIVRALDGRFSAKTVEIVNASNASVSTLAQPVAVGDSLFFAYDNEEYGGVWEFRPSSVRNNMWTTTDITSHVPGYLPVGPRRMVGSSKHNMLFYLDDPIRNSTSPAYPEGTDDTYGEAQNLYVYTYMDQGADRVQSAWTKWVFNADKNTGNTALGDTATGNYIHNMAALGDKLYLITGTVGLADADGASTTYRWEWHLESIDLDVQTQDDALATTLKGNFNTALLDRKTSNTQIEADGSESYGGGNTTIVLPWTFDANMKDSIEVVTSDGTRYTTGKSNLNTTAGTISDPGTVVVLGANITSRTYWVGFAYDMVSTYGPFAPQVQKTPLRGRNTFVRGGRLTYTKANEFDVKVTHGGTTYTDTVSEGTATGTTSGEMYFGIRKHMPDLDYTITNSSPWNAMFQGIMYDLNIQEVH